jgi:hypothetical protein
MSFSSFPCNSLSISSFSVTGIVVSAAFAVSAVSCDDFRKTM